MAAATNAESVLFYLESMSASARAALRRRQSTRRYDRGFEELSRLRPNGQVIARRGDAARGEPEWSITIFGLAALAELVVLDALLEQIVPYRDVRSGSSARPVRDKAWVLA